MQLHPARFDPTTGGWHTAPPSPDVTTPQLRCVTFNVWFDDYTFAQRAEALLELLLKCDADIIALQEVTPPLLEHILATDWLRAGYAISDHTGLGVWPYGTLLLTRWTPQRITSHALPTEMGRRLLVAELALNGSITTISTVHLESLRASADTRAEQLTQIFPLLAPAPHALLMGDFNFCASWAAEQAHLDPGYTDLWAALHPGEPGYTEDTVINTMRLQQKGRHKHVRFDRVLLRSSQPGWSPQAIQLLGTRLCQDSVLTLLVSSLGRS